MAPYGSVIRYSRYVVAAPMLGLQCLYFNLLINSDDYGSHLESVLAQYDTLHTSDMTHVFSDHTPHTHTRLVTFSSLGRFVCL